MPNIDLLLDNIAHIVKSDIKNRYCFQNSTLDMHTLKSRWIRKHANQRTVQFQLNRWQCNWNISIPNRILRSYRHASRIRKSR